MSATVQTNSTASYLFVEARLHHVPVVVFTEPKCIISEAFCATFQPPAPLPATLTIEPTTAVVGIVIVTRDALFAMYPLFILAD